MDNQSVADALTTIAHILQLQGENPFKVRAYENAARTVEGLPSPIEGVIGEGKLGEIPGFGEALQKKVTELVQTGRMAYLEELRASVPAGLLELLRIPSLGPKKVKTLFDALGVKSLAELEAACHGGRVAALKGFGAKSEAKILAGIALLAKGTGQFRLGDAIPVARRLVEYLQSTGKVERITVAGSVRRWKEIIRDVDILATSRHAEHVMAHFVRADGVESVLGHGPTKSSVLLRSGLQVDLRVVDESQYAPALLYFTGSKEHNVLLRGRAIKLGYSLNEYGLFKGDVATQCSTEEEIYRLLGLNYVPPELREATGELDVAESGAFGDLIDMESLKGTFHVHSTWSDGTASIEAMTKKAQEMGLSYMGLSDHSKTAAYANGLNEARLAKQILEIDNLNEGLRGFRILKGMECDILPDGALDLSDEMLSKLDFVIGSIHSRFDMSETEMTARVCKALGNKYLTMLGHPTGRLILDRPGFKVDLERVIDVAARTKKVIELNANPHRLDLDATHVRRAKEKGVMTSINPDAHSPKGLEDIEFGVHTGRRGWLRKNDVLNTMTLDSALKYLGRN